VAVADHQIFAIFGKTVLEKARAVESERKKRVKSI